MKPLIYLTELQKIIFSAYIIILITVYYLMIGSLKTIVLKHEDKLSSFVKTNVPKPFRAHRG